MIIDILLTTNTEEIESPQLKPDFSASHTIDQGEDMYAQLDDILKERQNTHLMISFLKDK